MSTALLGLFKAIQESERKKGKTKDTLAEMFQKGLRPRAGGTGLGAPSGGFGGFLQEAFGGGQEIDYSQFEGPPQLVSTPRGGVTRVGDAGRGDADVVVEGEAKPPIQIGGKLIRPDTYEEVYGPQKMEEPTVVEIKVPGTDQVIGWSLGQIDPNTNKWVEIQTISKPKAGEPKGLQQVTLPDGSTAVFDPNIGAFADPAAREGGAGQPITAPERFTKPEEPRPAGDVQAAMRAMMDIHAVLDDDDLAGEMDEQQIAQLESLRNELILAFPQLTREGLDIPLDVGAAGAAGRIDALGGTPTQSGPGVGATVARTVIDIVKDIDKTLKSLPPGRDQSL
jgi:hypothetical protein